MSSRFYPVQDNFWQKVERKCGDKKRYENQEVAERSARAITSKTRRGKLEAYQCFYCKHWHVGHPPQKKKKMRS